MEDKTEFLAVKRLGCEFSNKQFLAPSQLENHVTTFDDERPHECSSCFKRFKCYDDLAKHFARHTDKERVRCDICDKDFSESRYLTDHGPRREKTCLRWFANNKGADQPAQTRSLISAFVVRLL